MPPGHPARPVARGVDDRRRLHRQHDGAHAEPGAAARRRLPGLHQCQRLHGRRASGVEEALDVGVVVLCDHVPVPQLRVHGQLQRHAVGAEDHVVPAVGDAGDAAELVHGGDVPPGARRYGRGVVVAVGQLRCLPHCPLVLVARRLTHRVEVGRDARKVAWVEEAVCVRHGQHHLLHVKGLCHGHLVRLLDGPLQVGGLARDLWIRRAVQVILLQVRRVEGGEHLGEGAFEVAPQALGLRVDLGPLALLHGEDDPEVAGAFRLADGRAGLRQHLLVLLVVREDDDVPHRRAAVLHGVARRRPLSRRVFGRRARALGALQRRPDRGSA
mmetsp:Transcript_32905/g.86931  ORF Transcript_32905/g.86931 Transcript_32905/m.86931 type:complete len:327 (-) Transcript_32905:320-1300(-)